MIQLFRVLILLSLAFPALADELRIIPQAPDSDDVIVAEMSGTWPDSCVPRNPAVSRSGNDISVTLTVPSGGACAAVISSWNALATVGRLPPGVYTLAVYIPNMTLAPLTPWRVIRFPVTDADSRFSLSPNVGSMNGGTEVLVSGAFGSCPFVPPCFTPQVLFGGVPATSVREVPNGIVAITPSHPPAVVNVELRGRAGTTLSILPAAFTFAGGGPADQGTYTPVLVPLLFKGPGAHGAQWFTEAEAYNDSQIAVTPLNRDAISNCLPTVSPCPAPPFASGAWTQFHHGASYPAGLVLWLPRSQANNLHFSIRVRDLARTAESNGTDIPVVREEDLRDVVHLLNLPFTSATRHTLRIYDLAFNESRAVDVSAYSPAGELLATRRLELTSPEDACLGGPIGCLRNLPRYAALSDFLPSSPAGLPDRVRLEVRGTGSGMRLWAFVTVTNNTTQQITTITPQ